MHSHPSLPEGEAKTGPAKSAGRDLRRLAAVAVLGAGLLALGLADRSVPAVAQLKAGGYKVVHMKGRDTARKSGPARENWLLIKHRDDYAKYGASAERRRLIAKWEKEVFNSAK